MDKYLIQLIDKSGTIVDACTFRNKSTFRSALKSDWATLYDTTCRCWDITNITSPVRI